MLKHNLRLIFRKFKKDKSTFSINLLGLTIGLVVAISIFGWVINELSYDKFHAKSDRIYRIVNERFQHGEMIQKGTITYPTIGPTMLKDYPEVTNNTRISYQGIMNIAKDDKIIRIDDAQFTDQHFFEMFDFELLAGDRKTALAETNQVVLTETVAKQLFDIRNKNYESIIGESIEIDRDEHPSKVVGVLKDLPSNSIFQLTILGSYATFIRYSGEGADNSWDWSDFYHFVELDKQTDVAALEAKFPAFSKKYFVDEGLVQSEEKFYLQPLEDAYLQSADLEYEIMKTGNARAVWSLLGIAFIILIIAWVNYINLSSVKAIERAREVGLRRVIGAGKKQLTFQFLQEAFLINAIAILVAVPMIVFFKPWFNKVMGVEQSAAVIPHFDNTAYFMYGSFGLLIILGILISGLYPSYLLSSKNTPEVLKGKFQNTKGSKFLRKGLVVSQFTMSISLIIITMFVYRQIKFLNQKDLGVKIDQVMVFNGPELSGWDSLFIGKMNSFTNSLSQFPNIKSANSSSRVPGQRTGRIFSMTKKGDDPDNNFMCNFINADYKYDDTYDLKTLAGRFFRPEDSNVDGSLVNNVTINEAARKMLSYENNEAAIGKVVNFFGNDYNIVGVFNDYHQRSIHQSIEPLVIVPYYSTFSRISVKVAADNIDETIAQVKTSYESFFPNNPFTYYFLDDQFAQLYQADKSFGQILLFFTFLAIFVACLGLFGLASYTAHLRTKEIGIRKVLGSSVSQIVTLLSVDFLKLVFVAVLFAIPIAWYCSQQWLQAYEYRISLEATVFILSGVIALGIAFFTISFQSLQAAFGNPVDSLKNE